MADKTIEAQLADAQLLIDQQTAAVNRLTTERDQLQNKVVVLTQRVSELLKDKAQLEAELNAARTR